METDWISTACGSADGEQPLLLPLLGCLAKIEDAVVEKRLLNELLSRHAQLAVRVDSLLKNTLPAQVAEEMTYKGVFTPAEYDCTILFTDFEGFTQLAETMDPDGLVDMLHRVFSRFDGIVAELKGTKIKTIGDAYMAVFGTPERVDGHAERAVRAGLAMLESVRESGAELSVDLRMRVGVHTGRVVAGVVGKHRMQFDIFGDDVNIAARFESSGSAGRLNISENTRRAIHGLFRLEERGLVALKNKEPMKAYFVIEEMCEANDG
jgi:class 3 adenylate cyclase